jgi:replicative DNA helicase
MLPLLEQKVLLSLCDKSFYADNKSMLSPELFQGPLRDIYTLIVDSYQKMPEVASLNKSEIMVIWEIKNPLSSNAQRQEFSVYLDDVFTAGADLKPELLNLYIQNLWERHTGHKIASLGLAVAEGDKEALTRLIKLLEDRRSGFMPTDFGDPTTQDLDVLLGFASDDNRFKFNIESLSRHVFGIGPGEFGVIFALPETGKSAFALSLCCAPNGFCDQGIKVLYLGNEERTERMMLRAIQSYTGMTKDEISAKDQGDKLHLANNTTYSASHERLRELFKSLREMAKRRNCALLTVSQASAEAKGRTRLSPFDMEGSKIGKAAETDLIIGIGKHEAGDIDDSEVDNSRYLTVSKNKLSGWHGTIIVQIEPEISRYIV